VETVDYMIVRSVCIDRTVCYDRKWIVRRDHTQLQATVTCDQQLVSGQWSVVTVQWSGIMGGYNLPDSVVRDRRRM